MALRPFYVSVTSDHHVVACTSFDRLWYSIQDTDFYLDEDNEIRFTRSALKFALKDRGEAYVYRYGSYDWYQKVTVHFV